MLNYKCDICGKPAVVHYQTCELKWNIIDDKIDLTSEEFLSGDDSEYFCDECDMKAKKIVIDWLSWT